MVNLIVYGIMEEVENVKQIHENAHDMIIGLVAICNWTQLLMVYFNFFTIKLYESIDHCEYCQNK